MSSTDVETGLAAVVTDRSIGTKAAEYLSCLQHLSLILSDLLTPEQAADALLTEGVCALNPAAASIGLLSGDGTYLETVTEVGFPPHNVRKTARFPLDAPIPLAEAVRQSRPILLHSAAEWDARYPPADGMRDACSTQAALSILPIQIQGRAVGAIGAAFSVEGPLPAGERLFLETVAQMGGLALERARLLETEHQTKETTEQLQKRLETMKQGESARARNFFDSLSDGFIAYTTEWRILYVNEAAAAGVRMSREELVGKVLWDLFPELAETNYAAACRQVLTEQQPVHSENYWPRYKVWFENDIIPTDTGIAVLFRDITERKQTERFQKTINNLFLRLANVNDPDTILESVVRMVCQELEADGCTMTEVDVDLNRSEVLCYYSVGPPSITGSRPLSDLITPEWIALYRQGKTRIVEDTSTDTHSGPHQEKHYRSLHVGAFVSAPFLHTGRWIGTLGVYTQQPRKWQPHEVAFVESVGERAWLSLANARLLQAERERSQQLSLAILEVHHRVKNNLQAVSALLEMQINPGAALVSVEAIQDSLSQIKTIALVHDLLAHDKPIGGVNIAQVLTNLAGLLSSGMRQTEYPLSIAVRAEPLWMSTKAATSLSLAVNELLTNAVKHCKGSERNGNSGAAVIEVTLEKLNDDILLTIQDQGPGFPAGFDPIADANIGLQLVVTLVEHDLKGRVSFKNHFHHCDESLPAGARVEITFSENSVPE